jgi:hypothetical protein
MALVDEKHDYINSAPAPFIVRPLITEYRSMFVDPCVFVSPKKLCNIIKMKEMVILIMNQLQLV